MDLELELKQRQFNSAMESYCSNPVYKRSARLISTLNVSLQIFLLYRVAATPIDPLWQVAALFAAFVLTDFVNGLVHMFMDNNDRYDSLFGPLIANFHMHHKKPMYRINPLHIVYFNETGSKVWLVAYLVAVAALFQWTAMHPAVAHLLVYFGILSSVAEVSHYLCHTANSPIVIFLARIGILLGKRHHGKHHMNDNSNYAFLNGFTDPLINLIARKIYPGYKSTTDLHFASYSGADSDNR